jgi:ferredoxin
MDPNVSIHEAKTLTCTIRAGRRSGYEADRPVDEPVPAAERRPHGGRRPTAPMPTGARRLRSKRSLMANGFFTDTTLCIGCKACEVACKQWNQLPADGYEFTGDSYDNTSALGGTTWRHVAFIEQNAPPGAPPTMNNRG